MTPPGAQAHSDEAGQIARLGSIKLYLADVFLRRARLLRDKLTLAQAPKRIEHCGYWRRKVKLQDAEEGARPAGPIHSASVG